MPNSSSAQRTTSPGRLSPPVQITRVASFQRSRGAGTWARRLSAVGVMNECVTRWRAMKSNAHSSSNRCWVETTVWPCCHAGSTVSSQPPTHAQSAGVQNTAPGQSSSRS